MKHYEGTDSVTEVFVFGAQFGPQLVCSSATPEDALSEFDEQFGERVTADDVAIQDYKGATTEAKIEAAMSSGDIRINDGGTTVWVDPYEWMETFENRTAAAQKYPDIK